MPDNVWMNAVREAVFLDNAPRPVGMFKIADDGKRGEPLFKIILEGIREIYETDAVIAGGAVRDLAAGVFDHKDVDVFIPVAPDTFAEHYPELGWQGELVPLDVNHGYSKKKKKGNTVGCLFPTVARYNTVVQNVPVDLVFMKTPLTVDNVATFPVYAQRGVWTLEEGQVLSPEAKNDIENKTFTIDPSITEKEKVLNVLEKVKGWKQRKAYHDWKVIEPEIKEWWEAKEAGEAEQKVKQAGIRHIDKWWNDFEAEFGKLQDGNGVGQKI